MAHVIVVADYLSSHETGHRMLKQQLELDRVELLSEFRVLAQLKDDQQTMIAPGQHVQLLHYFLDTDKWRREHPGQGLVGGLPDPRFEGDKGPYLMFLRRNHHGQFEPLSVRGQPIDSVFVLKRAGEPALRVNYSSPPDRE